MSEEVEVGRTESPEPQLRSLETATIQTVAELAALLRQLRRRDARRRAGAELTYRQLASRAGWSHAVVADYLTGKTLPPTDRFDVLIRLLGTTPAEQGALATARDRVDERRRSLPAGYPTRLDRPTPRQLPADVPGFVGRGAELAALDRLLENSRRSSTLGIAVVTGTVGVGKSGLALHWAHRARPRFPDGQLYADLRGHAPEPPADPAEILDGHLTALGVPAAGLPTGLDPKAALFRSLLDGRRVLVLLDNAANADQIRPLLPGSPGCLVLVTSRNTLTGLVARDRARRLRLDGLAPADAATLLAGFVGAAPLRTEAAAGRELARLCDHLPLALCAAGENAANRVPPDPPAEPFSALPAGRSATRRWCAGWAGGDPGHPVVARPLTGLVTDLATADRRLDLLQTGDDRRAAVREAISWSYQRLPPRLRPLFRLLGLPPGPDLDRYAFAALTGTDPGRAEAVLADLAAVSLLQPQRPGRYRLPGLLREYARECADRHDRPATRHAALSRLFGYYRRAAATAVDTLRPQQRSRRPPLTGEFGPPLPPLSHPSPARAWLRTERLNLLAAVAHAARHGWSSQARDLAATLARQPPPR